MAFYLDQPDPPQERNWAADHQIEPNENYLVAVTPLAPSDNAESYKSISSELYLHHPPSPGLSQNSNCNLWWLCTPWGGLYFSGIIPFLLWHWDNLMWFIIAHRLCSEILFVCNVYSRDFTLWSQDFRSKIFNQFSLLINNVWVLTANCKLVRIPQLFLLKLFQSWLVYLVFVLTIVRTLIIKTDPNPINIYNGHQTGSKLWPDLIIMWEILEGIWTMLQYK